MFKSFLSRYAVAFVLMAGVVFSFSACMDDDDFEFEGTGSFIVSVEGRAFEEVAQGTRYLDSNVTLLSVKSVSSEGVTYIVSVMDDEEGSYDIETDQGAVKYVTKGGEILGADRGTIEITELTETKISGTFDFTVDDGKANGTPLVFSGGSFSDVSLEEVIAPEPEEED